MRSILMSAVFVLGLVFVGCGTSSQGENGEGKEGNFCQQAFAKVDEICKASAEGPGCQQATQLVAPLKESKDEQSCEAALAPLATFAKMGGAAPVAPKPEVKTPEGSGSAPTE